MDLTNGTRQINMSTYLGGEAAREDLNMLLPLSRNKKWEKKEISLLAVTGLRNGRCFEVCEEFIAAW